MSQRKVDENGGEFMFDVVEIPYEKLEELKEQVELELLPYFYKKAGLIFTISNHEGNIGIIIIREYSDGFLIEYFEIVKNQRNKKLGRKFIYDCIQDLKTNIYVAPFPEKERFWKNCGFKNYKNISPMLCYKYDNDN